jgi:hypothetical protein
LGQIINAVSRAIMVFMVMVAPSFLLPGASRTGQEISLIIGGLLAVFTVVEYASSHPGLVDFRFAPPYNRFRFFSFTVVLLSIVFLCRATEGLDAFAVQYLDMADQFVALLTFPVSPVVLAQELIGSEGDAAFQALIARATALSYGMSLLAVVFFTLFLWLMRWPGQRENFNLWINMPTFDPTLGKDITWRLRRGGLLNVIVGLALPYAVLVIVSRTGGWFDPSALQNYQSLIWGCVIWSVLPLVLFIRGQAMLKIAWLIDRARTD